MKDFFDNQRILTVIWNRKFHFIILGVIAVVLSAVFSSSFFITPKYKSTARVYPTRNIFVFSEESESEQLLEVMSSRDVKMMVIDSLRLDTVYKIDLDDPHYNTSMIDIFNDNVSIRKTEFETIEITALDKDPKRACDICNSMISFYNEKIAEMHAVKYYEIYELTDKRLNQKYAELDTLQPKYDKFTQEYNFADYNNQVKEVTRAYMKAIAANGRDLPENNQLKKQYENLEKYGSEAYATMMRYLDTRVKIDSMIESKTIALAEATKRITYSHVVETPVPADKKSFPVRWIIVMFSLISTIFAGLLVFLVLDYRKNEQ
jgi:capsular polysaccharide biosynthesis protein